MISYLFKYQCKFRVKLSIMNKISFSVKSSGIQIKNKNNKIPLDLKDLDAYLTLFLLSVIYYF